MSPQEINEAIIMNQESFKHFIDDIFQQDFDAGGNVDNRIKNLLPSEGDKTMPYRDVKKIGKGLLRERLLDGVDNQRYIDVIDIIHSHLGGNIPAIKDFEDVCWTDVVKACREEMPVQRMDWLDMYDKEHRRAEAAKRLREFGVKVTVDNFDYSLDNEDVVFVSLVGWIRQTGGRRFLNLLLSQMVYIEPEGRFLTEVSGNTPDLRNVVVVKPYNYLVNLALANFDALGGTNSEAVLAYKKAVELATDYCFVKFPVQFFGYVWEDLFHGDRDMIEYFTDLVYKESIFGLSQHSVWYSKMFCERVLKMIRETGRNQINGYSMNDFEILMNHVLTISDPSKCVEITSKGIKGLGISEVDKILADVTTDATVLNKDYLTPLDEEKENATNKPLVKLNGKYFALPATIGSWGWYEALMTVVRNNEKADKKKDIDAEVGKMIESFINEQLDRKGISHCCGKYTPPPDSEADLVIEADKGILLFEMKKKSLTRKAKAGNGFKIVSDLLGSLIDSQAQCFRTSHLLKKQGYIDLDDNGVVTRVERSGRESECITVCLGAFGPLQDRLLIKAIMEEISGKIVSAGYDGDDAQTKKEVARFNKVIEKWIPYLIEERTNGDSKSNPFFNSWFLDLEQLMLLISESSSNNELLKRLRETKHVSTGSYDFYRERRIIRLMRVK